MEDNMMREEPFVLVRAEMLPEAMQKTLEAKKLLEAGDVSTVQEAVEKVGLSRSSFYKYKDSVFPFHSQGKRTIVTLSFVLEHRAGVLSNVLGSLARAEANVLTIHQTIPLQGLATVSMSVDTSRMKRELSEVLDSLNRLEGVRRAVCVATGE
jgi:chorismate mutase